MTTKKFSLVDQGYRCTSRRHCIVARVDRPDWREYMARKHSPWDPEGEGMAWVNALGASAADHYRRCYTKDKIQLRTRFKFFPGSSHDPIGYMPREKADA